jgi:NADH:ubiquinone oxidoreductase subunit 3 (subunit A)
LFLNFGHGKFVTIAVGSIHSDFVSARRRRRLCGRNAVDLRAAWQIRQVQQGQRCRLVAMLFILFDIEVVFMYPWAVVYRNLLAEHATRNLVLGSMVSFLGILFVGYIYALKKKAFDWKT